MSRDCSPAENTRVHFLAATAFVRSYRLGKKSVSDMTSSHGANEAILMH